jgi:tRNA A37 N6-isopentenylltransferase MiaA
MIKKNILKEALNKTFKAINFKNCENNGFVYMDSKDTQRILRKKELYELLEAAFLEIESESSKG